MELLMNFIKILRHVQYLANSIRLKDRHNVFRYCKPSVCSKERQVIFEEAFELRKNINEKDLSCQWVEFYPYRPEKAKNELRIEPRKNGFITKMNVGKIIEYGNKFGLTSIYVARKDKKTSYSGIFNTSNENRRFLKALSDDATNEYKQYLEQNENS